MNENQQNILLSPVLIVGAPRSGTTWLQKMLLESPLICGGQESYFYSLFYPAFKSVADQDDARRVGLSTYWDREAFNQQMHDVWINTFKSLLQDKPGAKLLLDKTPFHALYLDKIHEFLPQAKFIHLIRDSRSVTASFIAAAKGWGHYWAPRGTKKAALEWYRHVQYARKAKIAENKVHYLEIHYEDLIASPVTELTKIMKFCELDCNDEQLQLMISKNLFDNVKVLGSNLPSSRLTEVKEPEGFFRKGKADSWKSDLNWYQKMIVWRYTRKLMKQCGYNWQGRIFK